VLETAARRHLVGGGRLPGGSCWARHAIVRHRSSPPSGRAVGIIWGRELPPSQLGRQPERSGPDLLRSWHFLAPGQSGEGEEKRSKTRIAASQVPLYLAEGPPPAQAQVHRGVRGRAAQRGEPQWSPGMRWQVTTASSPCPRCEPSSSRWP